MEVIPELSFIPLISACGAREKIHDRVDIFPNSMKNRAKPPPSPTSLPGA